MSVSAGFSGKAHRNSELVRDAGEYPQQEASRFDRLLGRAAPFLLLAIVALGGFLRFYQIGSKGLWLDEAFSVWLAWQPVGEMLGWVVNIDQHPPLYYTLLHFWIALTGGDDAATVRALSALFGTLTIPVIYLLGRRLTEDVGVGLLAALILAVSPFHVRFAQETRMYTLLALTASLALYALLRLLTDPRSTGTALGQQFVELWQTWRGARAAEREARQDTIGYGRDFGETTGWVTPPTCRRWLSLQAVETDLVWLGYVVLTTATLLSHNTAVFFPIAVNIFVLGLMVIQVSGLGSQVCSTSNLEPGNPKHQGGCCSLLPYGIGSQLRSVCFSCGAPGSQPLSPRACVFTASSGCLPPPGRRSLGWRRLF